MDAAFIVAVAALVGFGFGFMWGRWSGFSDADEVFDEALEEVKTKWVPQRDERGRFIKRK